MTSTVLAQITDELSTNVSLDRELNLLKSAHKIIDKNLKVNVLTDRNDTYYRYVHRLMNLTFISLEKNNADIRLAAEAYYEHILKAYECYGFPETSLKILAMSIEKMNGARQATKMIKYLVYYLDILPKQHAPEKSGRTFYQEVVKNFILKSLNINQTICHQALEKWCGKLISSVVWQNADLKLQEITEKALQKLWSTRGHASRTMAAVIGAVIEESKEMFRVMFNTHLDKVIETFVSNQVVPVGTISMIRKSIHIYISGISVDSLKGLIEMLLLMIRDSSNEVAYDAFATLEELMKVEIPQMDGFVPGNFLKLKYGESISKPEEHVEDVEFVDPLVNADLYEQLQETKPPPKIDLLLEDFEKMSLNANRSVTNYVVAFLGKTFLLTGSEKLLKTDRQSKDSMKILALRVLNVICARTSIENYEVRFGDKNQLMIDVICYSTSTDDQLSQQAIKFMFLVLQRGTEIYNGLDLFKSVKKFRYLLDSVSVEHVLHLKNQQLLEYLEIMAFRSLYSTHYDFSLAEITSACAFMSVMRDWIQVNNIKENKHLEVMERFQNCLKNCVIDCWDSPRFINTISTMLNYHSSETACEDQYPPSLPLRVDFPHVHRTSSKANRFKQIVYDDWRTTLLCEARMPTYVKMTAILRESVNSPEFSHEKVPKLSRMHWNSDTLPAVLQVMTVSLSDSHSKEDCYHGFHVGMSVLNWVYRNVFIVRGAAETKEFPFLQHSRTEMDDTLGNRTEFRATLDAYYKTVQSSADEKLEQLLTPTINLMLAAMAHDFKTSTENILEIIVYITVLFTLSPISALKLLNVLLRCLLDPKLIESLTSGRVFYFASSNTNNFETNDEFLIEALKCDGDKYFNRWGDDMEVEKIKMGAMKEEILEQLEPLITQSLKCFRYRGKNEKKQVLQIMICLMNHKLKLSDADPTECLMKFAVSTFARPEECAHSELFDTLMHFLATATRFQKDESYQKPMIAATMLMKSIEKLSNPGIVNAMKAVSFALFNGRYEFTDIEEFLHTSHSTWKLCMQVAPTETLYTLSLLLEKNEFGMKNQKLFWSVLREWTPHDSLKVEVPFSAIALPVSLITNYLTSDKVNIFEIINQWLDDPVPENTLKECTIIVALYFTLNNGDRAIDWKRYFEHCFSKFNNTKATHLLSKYADSSLLPNRVEESDLDEELTGNDSDLCHSIICSGETSVLDFLNLIEREYPNDDSIWGFLLAEFRRLDDDLEHRLDITFRLQDLVDALSERFNSNMFLKLLGNTNLAGIHLNNLSIPKIKLMFDQVSFDYTEDGYVLRGIRNLLVSPRMLHFISEDELETAQMFLNLAEKVAGIMTTDALIATYSQYRIDFQVKCDMDEAKVKEIKKFALSMFAFCQEAHLRHSKRFSKTLSACFRHPILNSMFNIPLVAMKCFNWVPVVEILRKPTITCLPPTGHVCDVMVLEDMKRRLSKVGLVTNAQFEVLFTTMQAVIAHTVIGPEKMHHDEKDVLEREARSCNALQLYIATILTSLKYPNGGDPSSGFVLKSPYISELFLQSTEFAHLCNLKSVWKCEPRTAFTTPLERHDQKSWTHFQCDGKTNLYGICQTPLFSLWQLCGMMPIEFRQHANYHRIDHSASNYFLTSATNIDTISNVKQLMNIFEYWYSQGIGELGDTLLHSILHTILYLSDFFDDPDLHKAVLRTTSIIYRHQYDQNSVLSSFVHAMFFKSIAVLGADVHGTEFKPGEPESIALKLVSSGLSNDIKTVRIYTLAGVLYLVQSDSYESFISSIDILSAYLEKYLKKLANGSGRVESDESQFALALIIKLMETPMRLKQDKKTILKLLLASMRVRRERFIIELIAEGIEQLLCRSNEFNNEVINFVLVGVDSGDATPFPADNEYYCRAVYRILMVAATREKVANDEVSMTRIYNALQIIGFDMLSRGETAPAISRTLPFFSICVNGVETTISKYIERFVINGNKKDRRFVSTLINQIVETAATSKKWSVELKLYRERLKSKSVANADDNQWLLNILCNKIVE
ncbi:HunTingTin gene family member [Caenorhabditis elegans]|uniref:HunTingTin gene family member n=1 Tax=Caenorhabditis elegans TaxID=6239 RepID=A0ACB1G5T7_CAEEL